MNFLVPYRLDHSELSAQLNTSVQKFYILFQKKPLSKIAFKNFPSTLSYTVRGSTIGIHLEFEKWAILVLQEKTASKLWALQGWVHVYLASGL